jgi:thiamine-monophosphate kinase
VFRPPEAGVVAITTDTLIEEVDFHRRWTHPSLLGRKAVAICVSDLAAMGAQPCASLLALALPRDLTGGFFRDFMRGFLAEAACWGAPLTGGDLSRSSCVSITVTAWGSITEGAPVYRNGARADDLVFLAGEVGLARLGLDLLLSEDPPLAELADSPESLEAWAAQPERSRCLTAHLLPRPLVQVGRWLQREALANAMIDVSDGLAADLGRLAEESGLTAELDLSVVPRPFAPWAASREAVERALLDGGEDFALLFTASPTQAQRLRTLWPAEFPECRAVGRMLAGEPAVFLIKEGRASEYRPGGFDHFR